MRSVYGVSGDMTGPTGDMTGSTMDIANMEVRNCGGG